MADQHKMEPSRTATGGSPATWYAASAPRPCTATLASTVPVGCAGERAPTRPLRDISAAPRRVALRHGTPTAAHVSLCPQKPFRLYAWACSCSWPWPGRCPCGATTEIDGAARPGEHMRGPMGKKKPPATREEGGRTPAEWGHRRGAGREWVARRERGAPRAAQYAHVGWLGAAATS